MTGKTTLAKRLLEHSPLKTKGYTYQHLGRLPTGFHGFWDHVALASRKTVQDRFHLSEVVYAEMRGDIGRRLSPEQYLLLDAKLTCMGAYTVVLTADPDLIRSRWRDGEMYSLNQVLRVNDLYLDAVRGRHAYNPQVDGQFHFSLSALSPSDVEVRRLIDAYLDRQATLSRLLMDRTVCCEDRGAL